MRTRQEVERLQEEVRSLADQAKKKFGELPAEKLNWKPAPDRWSVAQCFDHLITTNNSYFPAFTAIIEGHKKTAFMERLPLLPRLWGTLLIKSLDPKATRKFRAPQLFQPSASDIRSSIIDDFATHQSELAEQMRATKALGLDRIIITSPSASVITYSLLDAFRILVVHERRHFQQAVRVAEDENFPS